MLKVIRDVLVGHYVGVVLTSTGFSSLLVVWLAHSLAYTVEINIFILSVVIAVLSMVLSMTFIARRRAEKEPAWKVYTEDRFHGMVWRWSYVNASSCQICDLKSYCVDCDHETEAHDFFTDSIDFFCPGCVEYQRVGIRAVNMEGVNANIIRLINRNIREVEKKAKIQV